MAETFGLEDLILLLGNGIYDLRYRLRNINDLIFELDPSSWSPAEFMELDIHSVMNEFRLKLHLTECKLVDVLNQQYLAQQKIEDDLIKQEKIEAARVEDSIIMDVFMNEGLELSSITRKVCRDKERQRKFVKKKSRYLMKKARKVKVIEN
ncbi:hypothetical protein LOK49_LG01G02111 [Camellia lanceoleosa]|uniref:Uncharacterized protein n=1 Tax=Camellia lanceoleosa TaxID=1840588 RepID=A0ACC0IZC6_9ERIC|nr:hypothetical protein LOK49_LG01G02111 [Camellia lanceoleosa]